MNDARETEMQMTEVENANVFSSRQAWILLVVGVGVFLLDNYLGVYLAGIVSIIIQYYININEII